MSTTDTQVELRKQIKLLRDRNDEIYDEAAANSALCIGLLRKIYDERFRLKPGDIVSSQGKLYKVKEVIVRASDDPDGKPGLLAHPQRATTEAFGTTVRNLFNDWEIVSQA